MDTEIELAEDAYIQAVQDTVGWRDFEHGAFMAYMDSEYHDPSEDDYREGYSRFQDAYRGEYENVTQYAEELISDIYDLDKMMGNLAAYFDYESFGRDMVIGGDIFTVDNPDGCVWIFDNNV